MDTKRILDEAQKEIRELLSQREQIDIRIKGLSQIIEGLGTLGEKRNVADLEEAVRLALGSLTPERELPPGFTDAVRHIIRNSGPVTATEIRDELQAAGYGGKTPKHTLISVYTVIGRIKGEISEVRKGDKPAYATSRNKVLLESISGSIGSLADMK
jgi:hypothetical protein